MLVTKRNGKTEELDLSKIHAVLEWACNGDNDDGLLPIKGVSVSQIEMTSKLHLRNKIKTKEIHDILIKAAADLISVDTPNYDQVAARLVWFAVRKEAFKNNIPPHLFSIVKNNVKEGMYTKELLEWYSPQEWDEMNSMIRHNRDDLFRYAGAEQMRKKYLVQNRKTKKLYESFQIPYILIGATLFANYPKETRMEYIKTFYDTASQHYISLPTPIMAGVRTPSKQFSSCCVIKAGDSNQSITSAVTAIHNYSADRAGIGIDVSAIRGLGQPVRKGEVVSTGVIPFLRELNCALRSVAQGGVRAGSGTAYYPGWHIEFENLIELKNNKGTEETRLRTFDYGVALHGVMYKRLVEDRIITLFSPDEVPDLYNAFYSSDVELFEKLYIQYENDNSIAKKQLPAKEYFAKLMTERFETGRIYIFNSDIVNSHTPFNSPIFSSNLCLEIAIPSQDVVYSYNKKTNDLDNSGEIGLCTLAAINVGKFPKELSTKDLEILDKSCDILVRALDSLLDYQDYSHPAAERHSKKYRPLGVGIFGFAHWLAKNKLRWGEDDTLLQTEHMIEHMTFRLIRSSIQLAKEYGSVSGDVKYKQGIFPKDTCKNKPLDLQCDWDSLKPLAIEYGIRNSTLTAFMPVECQHWENKLNLASGELLNFHELCDKLGINYDEIERNQIPTRFAVEPFKINTRNGEKDVTSLYYNGYHEVYEVTFEDGNSYKFTGNHLLRAADEHWHRVDCLVSGEVVITLKGKLSIVSVTPVGYGHTWDVSVEDGEQYLLPNGVVSHNTSSQLSNETNGIEPPLNLVTSKGSKDGAFPQVVPEVIKYGSYYQTRYDVDCLDYLKTVGAMQKFVDQSISSNTSYDPSKGEIKMSRLLSDLLMAYKLGVKTLYYNNTNDQSGEEIADDGCAGGACKL